MGRQYRTAEAGGSANSVLWRARVPASQWEWRPTEMRALRSHRSGGINDSSYSSPWSLVSGPWSLVSSRLRAVVLFVAAVVPVIAVVLDAARRKAVEHNAEQF